MKRFGALISLMILASLVTACAAPAPEVIEKVVTQVVKETVVVEGTPQVVEVEATRVVEVEKEVQVVETARGTCGTATALYWQAAATLNPYISGSTNVMHASSVVLEPLARYDESGNLVPWLAEEIPTLENGGVAEDLLSITWKLKPGLLWSDGTPVTAEDVVFSGEYCMDPEMGCNFAATLEDVASIEALDDLTVKIAFSKPKPFPYGPFVSSSAPILQKAQFQGCMGAKAQECSEQNFYPIGTGPYQVKEFRAEDVAVFEMNEFYRDPNKPCFSELIIKGGGDAPAAARAVLETGEADFAWNLQVEPQILNAMQAAGLGKVATAYGSCIERLEVNFSNPDPALGDMRSEWTPENPNPHPFLTDAAVRRALSLAIDRNTIAAQLYGAAGQPTCNIVAAPAIYASTHNNDCLAQNISLANQILDEAGWLPGADGIRQKDGVRLSILFQTSTNSVRQSTQALIKQWWSQIGVETELRNIDGSVFFSGDPASPDTYMKFYADIEMFTNCFMGTDPESYLITTYTCDEIARRENNWLTNNTTRWCSEEYDELVPELSRTADLDTRIELVKALNDMVMQAYAEIPLVHRGNVSAHANTLLGVRMNGWDSELWNVADWSRSGG
jgi:peptide/nickel transport system substrate-binding protein